MKAFKVTWKTFKIDSGFSMGSILSNNGYRIQTYEKFFGTKEAAEKFLKQKDDAAQELNLLELLGDLREVELE